MGPGSLRTTIPRGDARERAYGVPRPTGFRFDPGQASLAANPKTPEETTL